MVMDVTATVKRFIEFLPHGKETSTKSSSSDPHAPYYAALLVLAALKEMPVLVHDGASIKSWLSGAAVTPLGAAVKNGVKIFKHSSAKPSALAEDNQTNVVTNLEEALAEGGLLAGHNLFDSTALYSLKCVAEKGSFDSSAWADFFATMIYLNQENYAQIIKLASEKPFNLAEDSIQASLGRLILCKVKESVVGDSEKIIEATDSPVLVALEETMGSPSSNALTLKDIEKWFAVSDSTADTTDSLKGEETEEGKAETAGTNQFPAIIFNDHFMPLIQKAINESFPAYDAISIHSLNAWVERWETFFSGSDHQDRCETFLSRALLDLLRACNNGDNARQDVLSKIFQAALPESVKAMIANDFAWGNSNVDKKNPRKTQCWAPEDPSKFSDLIGANGLQFAAYDPVLVIEAAMSLLPDSSVKSTAATMAEGADAVAAAALVGVEALFPQNAKLQAEIQATTSERPVFNSLFLEIAARFQGTVVNTAFLTEGDSTKAWNLIASHRVLASRLIAFCLNESSRTVVGNGEGLSERNEAQAILKHFHQKFRTEFEQTCLDVLPWTHIAKKRVERTVFRNNERAVSLSRLSLIPEIFGESLFQEEPVRHLFVKTCQNAALVDLFSRAFEKEGGVNAETWWDLMTLRIPFERVLAQVPHLPLKTVEQRINYLLNPNFDTSHLHFFDLANWMGIPQDKIPSLALTLLQQLPSEDSRLLSKVVGVQKSLDGVDWLPESFSENFSKNYNLVTDVYQMRGKHEAVFSANQAIDTAEAKLRGAIRPLYSNVKSSVKRVVNTYIEIVNALDTALTPGEDGAAVSSVDKIKTDLTAAVKATIPVSDFAQQALQAEVIAAVIKLAEARVDFTTQMQAALQKVGQQEQGSDVFVEDSVEGLEGSSELAATEETASTESNSEKYARLVAKFGETHRLIPFFKTFLGIDEAGVSASVELSALSTQWLGLPSASERHEAMRQLIATHRGQSFEVVSAAVGDAASKSSFSESSFGSALGSVAGSDGVEIRPTNEQEGAAASVTGSGDVGDQAQEDGSATTAVSAVDRQPELTAEALDALDGETVEDAASVARSGESEVSQTKANTAYDTDGKRWLLNLIQSALNDIETPVALVDFWETYFVSEETGRAGVLAEFLQLKTNTGFSLSRSPAFREAVMSIQDRLLCIIANLDEGSRGNNQNHQLAACFQKITSNTGYSPTVKDLEPAIYKILGSNTTPWPFQVRKPSALRRGQKLLFRDARKAGLKGLEKATRASEKVAQASGGGAAATSTHRSWSRVDFSNLRTRVATWFKNLSVSVKSAWHDRVASWTSRHRSDSAWQPVVSLSSSVGGAAAAGRPVRRVSSPAAPPNSPATPTEGQSSVDLASGTFTLGDSAGGGQTGLGLGLGASDC